MKTKNARDELITRLSQRFHIDALACEDNCDKCWCGEKGIAEKLIPNFKFDIGDVIYDLNGKVYFVEDYIYSLATNHFYYYLDDRDTCQNFRVQKQCVEANFVPYKGN